MTSRVATPRRRRAYHRGLRAETVAAWLLRLKGYRILARRVETPAGEIDLVARRGRLVAIVEVKARTTLDMAAASVTPRQQRRIARAAEAWLARAPRYTGCDVRFDLIAIAPGRLPRHIADAWRS